MRGGDDICHSKKPKSEVVMASRQVLLSLLLLLLGYACATSTSVGQIPAHYDPVFLNRSSFPPGFLFGAASSSYQYEGAWNIDGRGPSIWDTFTHKYPEKISDRSNGDVANDQYHHYKEDVGILKELNFDAYRFSISWSRLLPNGKLSGGVNKEGVNYYNNLINELLAKGLKPSVTLFHWDLPQTLEDEFGGFLSPKIVNYYKDYAELCFKEFGDRVKHWITFNEPYTYSNGGYAKGSLAPGRCSVWQKKNCTGGDSGTEPYLVTHYQLLSHGVVVKLYKEKYQASQKGVIGITLVSNWFVPYSDKKHHKNAAQRAIDFMFGWFIEPLVYGDYPHSMRFLVGKRLPKFTAEEVKLVKGSYDFIGLNYYTAQYAAYAPAPHNSLKFSYTTDPRTNLTSQRNGVAIGQKAGSDWLYIYPLGIYKLLLYTKTKYNNPLIYITENGVDELNDPKKPLEQALNDQQRIYYYFTHLTYVRKAIKDGVRLKGYFAWSFLDNFEWSVGYTVRFGINFVDYNNGQKRYPKLSAHWFKNFLKKN